MQDDKILKQILRRLDILISLQVEPSTESDKVPVANKIRRLAELGLTPTEIAGVLGKPLNYVTGTLSRQKKALKAKGG